MSLRRGNPVLVGCSLGVVAAAIAACTAGLKGPAPSSSPSADSSPLPVVTEVGAAESEPQEAFGERKLDLTRFRPLLARDELKAVAERVGSDQVSEAVAELERIISQISDVSPLHQARLQFLLGRLALQADKSDLALLSFEQASQLGEDSGFALLDDARLHVAGLQLAMNKPEQAESTLKRITDQKNPKWVELYARALGSLEKQNEAEATWKRLIDLVSERSDAYHRALIGHARALWTQAENQDDAALRDDATRELALAQLGLRPEDVVYLEVEELKKSWGVSPSVTSSEELLFGIGRLVDKRAFGEASELVAQLQLTTEESAGELGCRLAYYRGKILAGQRKWGEAADALRATVGRCTADPGLHASLLFNAGKYSAADGRDSAAVRYYEELEEKYKDNSLADDARLRRAKSYKDMGSQARFVSLLADMPEDYPEGDMTMEGVLLLSLEQMVQHKWSEAASVLERAAKIVRPTDSARGHEYAGTERYFLARCLMELGEEERALAEYESLILEVPLSYYMLHAYSRLLEADRARAKRALEESLSQARKLPFEFPYHPAYETEGFKRALELLMVGDFFGGREALSELSSPATADDSLLWGLALLFDRAGDAHYSHQLARGRLTDWLSHYPDGDWRAPWEIGFPRPYLDVVNRESEETGVDPWLIYGVMREESTFVPDIRSHANAYGLMQIIPPTARGIGRKYKLPHSTTALKVPRYNIAIGSRVLAELSRRFKKNPLLAIPGYNAGPSRPGRWLSERPNIDFDLWVELIPFRETRRYTKRVLASRAAYAFTYYRETSDAALVLPKRLNLK